MKIIVCIFLSLTLSGQKCTCVRDFCVMAVPMYVGGVADGVNQTLIFHYERFKKVFPGASDKYWYPAESWKNKYQDADAGNLLPAYPFATNLLVGFSDGFHLSRTIDHTCTNLAITLDGRCPLHGSKWWYYPGKYLAVALSRGAGFTTSYNLIFHR